MAELNVVTDIVELDQARQRLPELAQRVGVLMSATSALKKVHQTIRSEGAALRGDPGRVRELDRDKRAAEERFKNSLSAVNALGAYVKDPETGLIDFYSWREGELVFLCWRHGEDDITSWHSLEEGFDGRKPV